MPSLTHNTALYLLSALSALSAAAATVNQTASQYYEQALIQLNNNDTKAAVIQLKNAVQQQSDFLAAHILLGETYLRQRDLIAAEGELLKTKQLGADSSLIVKPLAQLYLYQIRYSQLLKEIEPGLFERSLRPDLYIYRGHAQLQLNHLSDAINEYALAAQIDPQRIEPIIGKANVLLRRADFKGAQQAADEATQKEPRNAETWYIKAAIKHYQGDLDAALTDYQQALSIAPEHLDAHLAKIGILMDLRRDQDADHELTALRVTYPNEPRIAYLHAVLLQRLQRSEQAIAALKAAAEVLDTIQPEFIVQHAQSLMLASLVNYSLQRFEQATIYLTEYSKQFPDHIGAYKLRASVFLAKGEPEKAIDLLKPLLITTPNDYRLCLLLGTAYMQTGRHEQANTLLEQAATLEAQGGSGESYTEMGLNRLEMGQEALAVQQLELAVKHNPENIKAGIPLVITYINRQQGDKAVQLAQALSQQAPQNLTLLNLLGTAQVAVQKRVEARKTFEQALIQDPNFLTAHLNLSKLDVATGNLQAAKERLERLLKKFPENVAILLELAQVARTAKQPEQALTWLQTARKLEPQSLPALLALMELKIATGKAIEAASLAQDSNTNLINNLQVQETLGRSYLASDNLSKAAGVFQRMSRNIGFNAPQLYKIANGQVQAHDYSEAIKTLKKAVLGDANYLPAQVLLTELELRYGEPLFAKKRAEELVKQHPDQAIGYRLLGDIANHANNPKQALSHYQTAFNKQPETALLIKLYMTKQQSGEQADAMQILQAWLRQHPQDEITQLALAEGYLHQGQFELALPLYEQLQQRYPQQVDLLNNLAYLYFHQGDSRALSIAQQAKQLAPENPAVNDTLGWILVQQDKAAEGLTYLRHAFVRASQDAEIRYHIAVALHGLNRNQEAKQQLEQALKMPRDFSGLAEAKALLKHLNDH